MPLKGYLTTNFWNPKQPGHECGTVPRKNKQADGANGDEVAESLTEEQAIRAKQILAKLLIAQQTNPQRWLADLRLEVDQTLLAQTNLSSVSDLCSFILC